MDRTIDAIVLDAAKKNAAPRARSASLREGFNSAADYALATVFTLLLLVVFTRYFELGI